MVSSSPRRSCQHQIENQNECGHFCSRPTSRSDAAQRARTSMQALVLFTCHPFITSTAECPVEFSYPPYAPPSHPCHLPHASHSPHTMPRSRQFFTFVCSAAMHAYDSTRSTRATRLGRVPTCTCFWLASRATIPPFIYTYINDSTNHSSLFLNSPELDNRRQQQPLVGWLFSPRPH